MKMSQLTSMDERLLEYELLLHNLPDNIFLFDECGHCLRVYEGDAQVLNLDYQKFVGLNVYDAFSEKLARVFLTGIKKAIDNGCCQNLDYALKPNDLLDHSINSLVDDELWFEAKVKVLPFKHQGKNVVMWIARNITDRRRLEQEAREMAEKDDLTGLFNRRVFMGRLASEFAEFKRYHSCSAMLMIDIDNFKMVNDRLGHLTGDKVIQYVAEKCQDSLRASDLLARIGGEEFAVFLPQTGQPRASELAERLRYTIETGTCQINDFELRVTVSIGISSFRVSDDSHSDLLRRSDNAMYISKREGRNKITALLA